MTKQSLDAHHVRAIVARLPHTSERPFSSGAPRFFVTDRQFAYLKPDLKTLVVRVNSDDWTALKNAIGYPLKPEPQASPRQRALYAAIDLAAVSADFLAESLKDAWLTCAPVSVRDSL